MIVEAVEITVGVVLLGIRLGSGTVFSIPYFRNPVKFVVYIFYLGAVAIGHGRQLAVVAVVRITYQCVILRDIITERIARRIPHFTIKGK